MDIVFSRLRGSFSLWHRLPWKSCLRPNFLGSRDMHSRLSSSIEFWTTGLLYPIKTSVFFTSPTWRHHSCSPFSPSQQSRPYMSGNITYYVKKTWTGTIKLSQCSHSLYATLSVFTCSHESSSRVGLNLQSSQSLSIDNQHTTCYSSFYRQRILLMLSLLCISTMHAVYELIGNQNGMLHQRYQHSDLARNRVLTAQDRDVTCHNHRNRAITNLNVIDTPTRKVRSGKTRKKRGYPTEKERKQAKKEN